MKEQWKDVVGLEKYAQISNFGRVKTKDRYINNNGTLVLKEGSIRVLTDNGLGYMFCAFTINGKVVRKYVHRMVIEAFLGVCDDLDVNHIDHNKSNNLLSNLEYVTKKENIAKMHKFYGTASNINTCVDCNIEVDRQAVRCRKCADEKRSKDTSKHIPSDKELLENMLKLKSFEAVGRLYSVSGNTIKRWCKKYDMPSYIKHYK